MSGAAHHRLGDPPSLAYRQGGLAELDGGGVKPGRGRAALGGPRSVRGVCAQAITRARAVRLDGLIR